MTDLGTFGGDYGYSAWVNDSSEVVGAAANQNLVDLLAFYWKDGAMSSLGTLEGDSCSAADAINSSGLIVGGSGFSAAPFFQGCTDAVEHAVIWENGQIFDLNLLVTNPSDLTLTEATFVNDKGEISGFGTLPNFDTHAFLLIPCDAKNPGEGCAGANANVVTTQNTAATMASPQVTTNQNRATAAVGRFGVRRNLHLRGTALSTPAQK
jgi:probable HAF family extracellular repeat protein